MYGLWIHIKIDTENEYDGPGLLYRLLFATLLEWDL